jgi:hypothetical protein
MITVKFASGKPLAWATVHTISSTLMSQLSLPMLWSLVAILSSIRRRQHLEASSGGAG